MCSTSTKRLYSANSPLATNLNWTPIYLSGIHRRSFFVEINDIFLHQFIWQLWKLNIKTKSFASPSAMTNSALYPRTFCFLVIFVVHKLPEIRNKHCMIFKWFESIRTKSFNSTYLIFCCKYHIKKDKCATVLCSWKKTKKTPVKLENAI